MGLLLSVVISYAGVKEAIECLRHIISGVIPDRNPNFNDLVEFYRRQLHISSNKSSSDWIKQYGQGYLYLTEDKNGRLESAAIKYYDGQPSSAAILFSTKISSFGQESVDDAATNGDYRKERYTQPKPKTIISNTSKSFSVGNRSRSPAPSENLSDPKPFSESSFKPEDDASTEENDKPKWYNNPKSPTSPLPQISFESYDDDKTGFIAPSEDYLRSLDGIKFRPLQRSDPSGRRRSFRKRHSSSSNSSKDSRASREEELKIFTSLEEAEFQSTNKRDNVGKFGSAPNLTARSHSRSRSRENSREGNIEPWNTEASVDYVTESYRVTEEKQRQLKLDSFEENQETKVIDEVKEEEEEEVDFWANSGD